MYQNVLTPVTTFSIFKSGHQIATQLGYKMVHFGIVTLRRVRDYSLTLVIPVGQSLQRIKKAKLRCIFGFFVSLRLQKQAFDASGNKKSQPKG
jgi:hypothetical protein